MNAPCRAHRNIQALPPDTLASILEVHIAYFIDTETLERVNAKSHVCEYAWCLRAGARRRRGFQCRSIRLRAVLL